MLTLNLNKDALLDLMKNFYLLTNIKIALFDLDGYEILSYPKEHCAFCAKIRSYKKGNANCMQSNRNSFARCQQTQTLEIFHCHAGLLETTAPLIDNGQIIGYIMIGQFTENPPIPLILFAIRILFLTWYTKVRNKSKPRSESLKHVLSMYCFGTWYPCNVKILYKIWIVFCWHIWRRICQSKD